MTRLDKWENPVRIGTIWLGLDPELDEIIEARRKDHSKTDGRSFLTATIELSRELIFDVKDGRPVFYTITFTVEASSTDTVLGRTLDIMPGSEDGVKNLLIMAKLFEVPVYPNSAEVAPILVSYYKDIVRSGVTERNASGEESQYAVSSYRGLDPEDLSMLRSIESIDFVAPAEFLMMRQVALAEIERRDEAGRILAYLKSAINELECLLCSDHRNENDLQRCLTRNPILFGAEYRRIIPKHRLGSEYEMDYALERVSGTLDLVEIEASSHLLYNKQGNPTQHLVHAEQQVLDWLEWVERHSAYARESLPGVSRPVGYVIMGRSAKLQKADRERLNRRNAALRGTLEILTYDDLLDRSRNLLRVIEGREYTIPPM